MKKETKLNKKSQKKYSKKGWEKNKNRKKS